MYLATKIILILILIFIIIIIILVSTRLRTRFSLVVMGPVHPCLLPGGGEKSHPLYFLPSCSYDTWGGKAFSHFRSRGKHGTMEAPMKVPTLLSNAEYLREIPQKGVPGEPWRFSPNVMMFIRSALSFWWALTRRSSTREMLFHLLFSLLLHQYKFLFCVFPFLFKQLLWKMSGIQEPTKNKCHRNKLLKENKNVKHKYG